MATEKWIAGSGQGLTWSSNLASTELNTGGTGLINGNAVLLATQIDNSTALDMFMDISIALASGPSWNAPNYIGVYLYPLNSDGSTYGDGRFATNAAGVPPTNYSCGSIGLVASGSAAQEGTLTGIVIPPGAFKIVLYNGSGATLANASNTVKYRSYNRQVA